MQDNELISVIVPVYNTEKYVRQTLDSIVNQTYRNLEILVVDDGSTDNSPAICDGYSTDSRVTVFHRQNAGLAESRQFGVDHCSGAYFVTIDSDDYIAADYVEKLYRAIKQNDADISVCGVSCFADGKDNIVAIVYMPPSSYERLAVTTELLASNLYGIYCDMLLTDPWNKMHRTEFVRNTNVRFTLPGIYNGQDLQFENKLALHCPVYCFCRESLLFHRNRPGSMMMRTKEALWLEGFEIITESLMDECEIVGLSIQDQISNIYYGMIGIAVQIIMLRGGRIGKRHKMFHDLILQNNRFLSKHRNYLKKHTGFQAFKVGETVLTVPVFVLSNVLWLDAVSLCYCFLRKLKYRIRK